VTEGDALDFLRHSLGSVWALELLVLVGSDPARSWRIEELVHESRSSVAAMTGAALLLERAGLVVNSGAQEYRYQPSSPNLDAIAERVRKLYAAKPTTVIAAIFEPRNERLREFAQAFKFKE